MMGAGSPNRRALSSTSQWAGQMPTAFWIGSGAGGAHGESGNDGVAIEDIDAYVAMSRPSAAELTSRMP